jgi:hypothetical protein
MAKRAKKRKSTARRTSRPQKKLSDLFHETLKDIYFTENKIIKTLPKMAKAAQSKELAAAYVGMSATLCVATGHRGHRSRGQNPPRL